MSDNPDIDDIRFFQQHPDRKAHIRLPGKVMAKTTQRAVYFADECAQEFESLGDHEKHRRRIILTRADHRGMLLPENRVMKIPFLLFADETVEDTDEILLPIIHAMMSERT